MSEFLLEWQGSTSNATASHWDTPEHTRDTFSATLAERGLVVAGNWRPDNATALQDQLGLPRQTTPADILAAGWSNWGIALADRLRGPFAIAIFDANARTVYLARDAFGIEPLFVALDRSTLAIASNPKTARAAAGLKSHPDRSMVRDLLQGEISNATQTFHQGLERVPPGHYALIDSTLNRSVHSYYDLKNAPMRTAEGEPVSEFRAMLDREVALCSPTSDHLGIMLSGGLDSSAIAASVAHNIKDTSLVVTLSMTYDGLKDWTDAEHIASMRASLNMKHVSRDSTHHDPMADMATLISASDGPCFGYGVSVNCALFPMAKDLGVRTLLSGHGGDEAISYGLGRLNELALARRWLALWRESGGAAKHWREPRWRIMDRHLHHHRGWRYLRSMLRRRPATLSDSFRTGFATESLLNAGLAANSVLISDDLRKRSSRWDHTERDLHEVALLHPVQAHALETNALIGRWFGLDVAMPFYSRDLVEFSLSLPSQWKLRDGYTRFILREAMRGRVPDSVANRYDKHDFSGTFSEGVLNSEAVRDLAQPDNHRLRDFVNPDALRAIWAKMEQDPSGVSLEERKALWRTAVLAQWLDSDRDACLRA